MKTILGAFTVIICFFFLGRKATEQERTSLKHLNTVIKLTEHIKNRISASLTPLPDIYLSFRCDDADELFMQTLKEKGFEQAVKAASLPPEAYPPVEELAFSLGRLDISAQCEKLENACRILTAIRDTEKERISHETKSTQSLFLLAGALTVILMF